MVKVMLWDKYRYMVQPVLCIRTGFKADPDPTFLDNADPRFFDYEKF
jgi:hypothetical protein